MISNAAGVTGLGHVNIVVGDHNAAIEHWRRLFDAEFFLVMFVPEVAATNTLGVVGDTCIELFAPYDGESMLARTLARRGPGLFALEFRVEDYFSAQQAVLDQGLRIAHGDPGKYFWIHPADLGGISVELCPAHFENDPREEPGWNPERWAKGPIGITGLRSITIIVSRPAEVAERLGALFGASVIAHGTLGDQAFTEVLIAGGTYRLLEHAPDSPARGGVASLDFEVADLEDVHRWAHATAVPLVESGNRLALPAQVNLGSRVEFVAKGAA